MKLSKKFYLQDTETVARLLLGKVLFRRLRSGKILSGKIVETEAYLGIKDAACHTFKGRRTDRVETMYRSGGLSYVYQIYGLYFCLNVVTRSEAHPEAVLIRAVEPLDGIKIMAKFRNQKLHRNLTNGPGKLCQAFNIDKSLDGNVLWGDEIWIEDVKQPVKRQDVVMAPRIGVDYAGEAAFWPLRYYIKSSEFVSKKIRSFPDIAKI